MFDNIKYNESLEKVLTAIFGVVGAVAIFINLHLKGYNTENWLDAIKDLAGLLVVLAVFIASVRLSNVTKSFADIARNKLEKLRKTNPDFLMGPQYNREHYDPEKGKGLEYLFITNDDLKSKLRAKFVPVQSLEEGILALYVQKGTLVYGLKYSSEEATQEEIEKIQNEVKNAVMSLIQKKYSGTYEILPDSKKDTAVIIDFNESELGKRKFAKIVEECVECAVVTLKKFKK